MTKNAEMLILDLVKKHDGEWTWYQLEKNIGRIDFGGLGFFNVMKVVEQLIDQGMLSAFNDGNNVHPVYKITVAGQHRLQESKT